MLSPDHLAYLGHALRRLRAASACTQADVCARTGLLAPQLSRWENGRETPTLESLVKVLTALGAGFADLERVLLEEEERGRGAAVASELRRIRDVHWRRIKSSADLLGAVREVLRLAEEGFERRLQYPRGRAEPRHDPDPPQAEAEADALDPELERLLADLPEALERLLAHPARCRPAVVEQLVETGWRLVAERDARAEYVADAARVLAAELPESFERDVRFEQRARSLELWGTLRRLAGSPARAEAALLCALELLAQVENPEPRACAAILGRCALVAVDAGRAEDAALYAEDAVTLTAAADPGWPLPAFLHLWEAAMADPKTSASGVRLAEALFEAVRRAYGGFDDKPWSLSLEIADRGRAGCEIRLIRTGPPPGGPSRVQTDPLVCPCGTPPAGAKGDPGSSG